MTKSEQDAMRLAQELHDTKKELKQLRFKFKALQKRNDILETQQESKCYSCLWFQNELCTKFGVEIGHVSHCQLYQSYIV
jgi:hypothetical protein